MTDQEYEAKLTALMEASASKPKRKAPFSAFIQKIRSPHRKWSRKRKLLTGVAAVAVTLLVLSRLLGGGKEKPLPAAAAVLQRKDIQEVLSISGPVSGTDSAEVVSRLHAEILEILVKEGDQVKAGQVLARLDPTDVQRNVDIAQNAYDLAVANYEEAQQQAERDYAKAVQEEQAARRDYERKSVLFAGGDVAQTELEEARDALQDAERQVAAVTMKDGKPSAARSYELQIRNAEFELEQRKKELEETEVTSPIAGTVVRVNSRVGRFADTVDDDKPLFAIDNLEQLEMKINVSEYSIGKVKLGQQAQIQADILEGQTEEGVITAVSPTGEEKGGGSSERVIPTTIRISSRDTKLIAGITARAQIVLNEAKNAWVVPVGSLASRDGGMFLAAVEDGKLTWIPVETGVESDVEIEIRGEALYDGLVYLISPDAAMEEGTGIAASAVSAPAGSRQNADSGSDNEPDSESDSESESESDSEPGNGSDSEPESGADSEPESGAESKPENESESIIRG